MVSFVVAFVSFWLIAMALSFVVLYLFDAHTRCVYFYTDKHIAYSLHINHTKQAAKLSCQYLFC